MLKQPVHKKLPFWQRDIMVKPLTAEQIDMKYANRTRRCRRKRVMGKDEEGNPIISELRGKTEKDHASGSWGQRFTRVGSQLKPRQQHRGDVGDG